jgi:hypothetical protein
MFPTGKTLIARNVSLSHPADDPRRSANMVGLKGTAVAPGPIGEQAVRSYVRSGIKG